MIFYFTGTGNSLYAAKHFDKELYSIPQEMKKDKAGRKMIPMCGFGSECLEYNKLTVLVI